MTDRPAGPLPLPAPIILVTAAADVQHKYLAVLTVGWGLDGQAWVLDWDEIDGDPLDPATFDALFQGLDAVRYVHPTHGPVPVHVVGVDARFRSDEVRCAVAAVPKRGWAYTTVGEPGRLGQPMILPRLDQRDAHGRRAGYRSLRLNTDGLKSSLMAALQLAPGTRGSWHFPKRLDAEFYAQLTAEEVRPRFNDAGVEVGRSWVQTRERNEALDTACGNLALWHFVPDTNLVKHLVGLVGRDEARRQWTALYPSGRRFV